MKTVEEILKKLVEQYQSEDEMVKFWCKQSNKLEDQKPYGYKSRMKQVDSKISQYWERRMLIIKMYAFVKNIEFEVALKELQKVVK